MPTAYAVRDGGDTKSKKQSMADLKLRRLQELNSRLKEDLDRPRVKVAEASISLINYCNQTRDYMIPSSSSARYLAMADAQTAPPIAQTISALSSVTLPRITIKFCTQCKWNLRAAYYAQEVLQTFSTSLGEVALVPATGGTFEVRIFYAANQTANIASAGGTTSDADGVVKVTEKILWDRQVDGGFPETKELKGRVRDVVEPGRSLGHTDRALVKDRAKGGKEEADREQKDNAWAGPQYGNHGDGNGGNGGGYGGGHGGGFGSGDQGKDQSAGAITLTETVTAVQAAAAPATVTVTLTAVPAWSQPVPNGQAFILTTAEGALSPGLSSIPAVQAVQTGVTIAGAAGSVPPAEPAASSVASFFTQGGSSSSEPVPNGAAPILTTASGALLPGISSIPAASAVQTGVTVAAAAVSAAATSSTGYGAGRV
ncbi:hypothetical protein DV736_g3978, partial [Chaetothyriales sp. CBS 134916]